MEDYWKVFIQENKVRFLEMPIRDRNIVLSSLTKDSKRKSARENSDVEQHLVWSVASDAYTYMLTDNKTAKECLEYAARKHLKDIEKVFSEKSKKVGSLPRYIVREHDDHPIQKDMIKRKKLNKQSLANSKNIWQMLNTLSTFRTAYEELIRIEKAIRQLEDKHESVVIDLASAKAEIQYLKETTGLDEMEPKQKARYLKQLGYTQQQVADVIGKDVRTIRRWWNGM